MQQAQQQPGGRIALGSAILGAPAADGYAAPNEPLPDSWLLNFAEKYGSDADVCAGVFASSRKGRTWALNNAQSFTVSLDITEPVPPAQWQTSRCCSYIRQRQLSTGVRLIKPGTPQMQHAGGRAAEAVQGPVQGAGARLLVQACPQHFPAECSDRISRLIISTGISIDEPKLLVVLPSLGSVTQLRIEVPLTDAWLALVLDRLPHVTELTASAMALETEAASGRETHIKRLVFTDGSLVCLQRLAWMPLPADGSKLSVSIPKDGMLGVYIYPEVRPPHCRTQHTVSHTLSNTRTGTPTHTRTHTHTHTHIHTLTHTHARAHTHTPDVFVLFVHRVFRRALRHVWDVGCLRMWAAVSV